MTLPQETCQIHASAIAVEGRGCLLIGAAGSGKSTLALELIALGGALVADDRVDLRRCGDAVFMTPPRATAGLVEARGAGILRLPTAGETPLSLVVDLDRAEEVRLPDAQARELLGLSCPLILGRGRPGLASLIVVMLRAGGPSAALAGPAWPASDESAA